MAIISEKAKIKYSPMEQAILEALQNAPERRLTTIDLVDEVYRERRRPIYPRETLISIIKSLQNKSDLNMEDFEIQNTQANGPYPISWFLEKRKVSV